MVIRQKRNSQRGWLRLFQRLFGSGESTTSDMIRRNTLLSRPAGVLKLAPPGTRRRTVDRLDKAEVERLIRNTYQSHSKYGLMIKTLFLSGARVDEFVHIKVEDLHLEADLPQIYLATARKNPIAMYQSCRHSRRNCGHI